MKVEKVLYYLDLWKDYMKWNSGKSLGYPSKAAGFMSSGISSFDEMGEEIAEEEWNEEEEEMEVEMAEDEVIYEIELDEEEEEDGRYISS